YTCIVLISSLNGAGRQHDRDPDQREWPRSVRACRRQHGVRQASQELAAAAQQATHQASDGCEQTTCSTAFAIATAGQPANQAGNRGKDPACRAAVAGTASESADQVGDGGKDPACRAAVAGATGKSTDQVGDGREDPACSATVAGTAGKSGDRVGDGGGSAARCAAVAGTTGKTANEAGNGREQPSCRAAVTTCDATQHASNWRQQTAVSAYHTQAGGQGLDG